VPLITLLLFVSGIAMGIAAALMWAWGVRSGQFRDLEKTKDQLFWPELAGADDTDPVRAAGEGRDGPPAGRADGIDEPMRRSG
jgi:cbb3-type cytochrome oxidase maturation protein